MDRAKTEACTHSKHSAHNREDVDEVTHPSVDPVTKQGIEAGSHGHGKVFSVTEKGKKKSNHHIHDPTVNSPVKECEVHGILGSLIVGIPVIGEVEVSIGKTYMPGKLDSSFQMLFVFCR